MARFKDSAGREWDLIVDVVEMGRVRKDCGVHLGKLSEIIELAKDVEKLADVLWVMVEEQAKRVPTGAVTREQFLRSLVGDVNPNAHDALVEAFLFFCPTSQATAIRQWMKDESEKSEVDQLTTSSNTPGSSPASVESIPTAPV